MPYKFYHSQTEEEREERRKNRLRKAHLRWRAKNKGAYKPPYQDRLSDAYVFRSMVQREKAQYVKREDLPEELLDIQRAIITLKRLLKEM